MNQESRRKFLKTMALTGAFTGLGGFNLVKGLGKPLMEKGKFLGKRPNIVLLLSDDQSIPDLGCYGNRAIHTPHIDRIAREGMRFTRPYVASPSCSPSRGALLTGRSPHSDGSSRLHTWVLPEIVNIIELFKKGGYYTGAYRKVDQQLIRHQFDFYGGNKAPLDQFFEERPKDRPFFLWFGSHHPHRPYHAGTFSPAHQPSQVPMKDYPYLPDTEEVRQDLAYYYDQLALFDRGCGKVLHLLDHYGLAENTMVVTTSDNGLPFPRAKATLYEPGIKVPLVIRWPGKVKAGSVSGELVSLMDLPATWMDIAGLEIPKGMEGRSLVGALTGGKGPRKYVFAERDWHDSWEPTRTAIGQRYKLIQNYRPAVGYLPSLDIRHSLSYRSIEKLSKEGKLKGHLKWYEITSRPEQELYDLQRDPGEWNNLAGDARYEAIKHELAEALSRWMDSTNDFLPPPLPYFNDIAESQLDRVFKDIDMLNGTKIK